MKEMGGDFRSPHFQVVLVVDGDFRWKTDWEIGTVVTVTSLAGEFAGDPGIGERAVRRELVRGREIDF